MNDIVGLVSGSRLVDVVIGLTLIEAVVLTLYHRTTGRGVAPREFALNMLSGLCLMFALRSALINANWPWIALFLTAAGLLHAVDIGRRWTPQRNRI
jgi:hypothetical protein